MVEKSMARPLIVLFGDSLVEESFGEGGWGAALTHHFSRSADILLRGYRGYNSRWALKVLDRVMDGVTRSSAAVIVLFGADDAAVPDTSSGFQHVPPNEHKQNLQAICSSIKERWPSTVVILVTPPPVDESGRLIYPFGDDDLELPERTNDLTGTIAKACVEVQHYPNWEKSLLRDGMHLPVDLPLFSNLDPNNPLKSFTNL